MSINRGSSSQSGGRVQQLIDYFGRFVSRHGRRTFDSQHAAQEMLRAGIFEDAHPNIIDPEIGGSATDAQVMQRILEQPNSRTNNAPSEISETQSSVREEEMTEPQSQRNPAAENVGALARPLPDGWAHLDDIELAREYLATCPTLEDVPFTIRSDFTRILSSVVKNLEEAYNVTEDSEHPIRVRAWKLFALLSRMLLHRLPRGGEAGNRELRKRIRLFDEGAWDVLLEAARRRASNARRPAFADPQQELDQILLKASKLIEQGELSHAARLLSSNGIAPGNLETLRQLTDPLLRPPAPLHPIPPDIANYRPSETVELDKRLFVRNLRTARRGLSPGLGGFRNEHLKHALQDQACLDRLHAVAQKFAEADVPSVIVRAMRMCKLTAIKKLHPRFADSMLETVFVDW